MATTNPTAPVLTSEQKNWVDFYSATKARIDALNIQIEKNNNPLTQINQSLRVQRVETEYALREHFKVGWQSPNLIDLAQKYNASNPKPDDYAIGAYRYSNYGNPTTLNPQNPQGQTLAWQADLAASFRNIQSNLSSFYDSVSGDANYFFKEGVIRPGGSMLIDSLGGKYFITSPSMLFSLPSTGNKGLDFGTGTIHDDLFKKATGTESLGDRIMRELLGPPPGSQPKPASDFIRGSLNSLESVDAETLARALIGEAGAWAQTAGLGTAALQDAINYNQTLQAEVAASLAGKDIVHAVISNEDGILNVQFAEGGYFLLNRDGQGALVNGVLGQNGITSIDARMLDDTRLVTRIDGGNSTWTSLDANGRTINQYGVDATNGTLTYTLISGTTASNLYSLSTGALLGETQTLGDTNPYALTTDPLASLLTRYRHDLATEDYALVNAAEVRSLVSAQSGSEAWGGVDLIEFSGSYIGDYWNFSTSGINNTFGAPIDYSLAAGGRLSLADNAAPNFGGLDLMSSFSIGNSNTLLSNGSIGTANLSYEAWQYNTSAWYTPTLNLSNPSTPTIAPSYPTSAQFESVFTNIPSSSDTTFYYYGSNGSAYEWFIPVALDLDGDGIELIGQQDSRAWFDVKGDGFRRNIGWIGADDAFLAIDKNNDGKIEQADELSFALWTADADDSDLEALQTVFDSNHDGKISAADAQFHQLRIWQDKNGDGVTDAGELKTLAQAGITSLNLTAAKTDWVSGGNHLTGFTTYSKTDGTNGWAADVGLGYEADGWKTSVEGNLVRATQSGGLVYGLASGGTLNLDLGAKGLDGAVGGAEADTLAAGNRIGALLDGGAGNDNLTGGTGDDWLSGGAGSDKLSTGAGDDTLLIDAEDLQANINGGDGFDIAVVTGSAGVTLDLFHAKIEAAIGGDGDDRFNTTGLGRAILAGRGGNDHLKSGVGPDVLQGGTGNDILYGGLGEDIAVFAGNQADFQLEANANGSLTVRDINAADGDEGGDILYGIQTLHFADGDINLNPANTGKGEFRVNTTTTRDQFYPTVAALADGGYVVAWMDDTAVATDANIYAQRYGADGNALGAEFLVNTYTASQQEIPSVAGLSNGGFTVVWRSNAQDGSGRGIYGQRYASDGTRSGSEFRVNTYTTDHQDDPTVISLSDGGFLVTWQSNGQDGSGYGIYAQRYAADGNKSGAEFRVNTTIASHQNNPEVTQLTDSGYVVTWSTGATPSTSNIYAQRYDATGNKIGGEIKANTTVYGAESSVTALADGGYVVAWLAIASSSQWHVFAQRYLADGSRAGGELMLSTAATGTSSSGYNSLQVAPVVTALVDGSYVTTWTVYSASGADLYLRRAMDGNAIGDVIRVNTTTADNQSTPAVTAMPDGGFVVTWTSVGAGVNENVFAQRYDADGRSWTANQKLSGTAEADHINATSSVTAVNLLGLEGDDSLIGGYGNDALDGGLGNDLLNGGAGADTLTGGTGDDTYVVDQAGDSVTDGVGEGIDTIEAGFSYTLADKPNLENVVLTGSAAINATGNAQGNILIGNGAANTLFGADGNDLLNGGWGDDTMRGGAGDDTYIVDDAADGVTENANEGTDVIQSSVTYTLSANVENLILAGTSAINGTGNAASNALTGNSGTNILDGSTGADTMSGGLGNDTYVVDNVGDVVSELVNEGTDTVQSSITWTLGADLENLTLIGSSAINGTGNTQNNTLIGNNGTNTLDGDIGADTLNGGFGADSLIGGLGNDTYVVDDAGDVVSELVNEGTDTVQSSITWTLGAELENLTLTGSFTINGTGNMLNNTLTGNSGANTLDGGIGADNLIGGLGSDNYVVDDAGDVVTELVNEGTDTVQSSTSWTLGAELENLTLTGSSAINGTGNTLNNTLTGNSGTNTLDGGIGADNLIGGLGSDIYIVDDAGDSVVENFDEGYDYVRSSISYTLGANVDGLLLTGQDAANGTGNALDNVIFGNSGNNILYAGAGNDYLFGGNGVDTLLGGTGNDTYVVYNIGTVVAENSNEGMDTIETSVTWTLGANLENLVLMDLGALNGTGNSASNTLMGNKFANILNGGVGADIMQGKAGNDTYVVDNAGDVVAENTNEGTDTVKSSITYTLGNFIENLTLTGSATINGTGNTLNNILTGNIANNSLSGGSGNDTLIGGAGNDWLNGGAGADSLIGGDGTNDTAAYGGSSQAVSIDLGLNVAHGGEAEGDTFSGIEYLFGSNFNDTLIGDAGNNTLQGSKGNDRLNGGAGADTAAYYSDTGGVMVDLAAGTATDSYGGSDILLNIEHASGSNVGNDLLYGNAANNTLSGAGGNDVLDGRAGNDWMDGGIGNDTLSGGQGNDSLLGGLGNDLYLLNRGDGTDTLKENDATAGNIDIAHFAADIAHDQIWFRHVGNDLEALVIGTTDKAVIQNWYSGSATHIERFEAGDDMALLDSQVDALVQAMAGFLPPAAGQTSLPANYHDALAPVLAANWQ